MTKRTNAELLSEANERVARLRRVEAAKGDPRITQARKLAVALHLFIEENPQESMVGCLDTAVNALDEQAAVWVEEFFEPAEKE